MAAPASLKQHELSDMPGEQLSSTSSSSSSNCSSSSQPSSATVAPALSDKQLRVQAESDVARLSELIDDLTMIGPPGAEHATQLKAIKSIGNMLTALPTPPVKKLMKLPGLVDHLWQLMQANDSVELQSESWQIISCMATCNLAAKRTFIDRGIIPLAMQKLTSGTSECKEQAADMLGSLAYESVQCRDLVLQAGALPPLLDLCNLDATNLSMLREGAECVSFLCCGDPTPDFHLIAPILPVFAQLLQLRGDPDKRVIIDVCTALLFQCKLSDEMQTHRNAEQVIPVLIELGVVPCLVELLAQSTNIAGTCACILISIATCQPTHIQMMIDCGVLVHLLRLLSHQDEHIRVVTCNLLFCILDDTRDQIQQLIDAQIVSPLVSILNDKEANEDIKSRVAMIFAGFIKNGSEEQIRFVVDQGIIPELCSLLSISTEKGIVRSIFLSISRILSIDMATNSYAKSVEANFRGGLKAYIQLGNRHFEAAKKELKAAAAKEKLKEKRKKK